MGFGLEFNVTWHSLYTHHPYFVHASCKKTKMFSSVTATSQHFQTLNKSVTGKYFLQRHTWLILCSRQTLLCVQSTSSTVPRARFLRQFMALHVALCHASRHTLNSWQHLTTSKNQPRVQIFLSGLSFVKCSICNSFMRCCRRSALLMNRTVLLFVFFVPRNNSVVASSANTDVSLSYFSFGPAAIFAVICRISSSNGGKWEDGGYLTQSFSSVAVKIFCSFSYRYDISCRTRRQTRINSFISCVNSSVHAISEWSSRYNPRSVISYGSSRLVHRVQSCPLHRYWSWTWVSCIFWMWAMRHP